MGIKYIRDFDRVLNAVLRKIGFDKIFLSGTGTDILIRELTDAVAVNKAGDGKRPLIVSACPAWVKHCEQVYPELLQYLSPLKTPQQITGAIIKSAVVTSKEKSRVYTVSVSPCTAMKFEARRDSMTRKGISDIDTVLTVRELSRLIGLYGIDISNIDPEAADDPMSSRSSAALLAETSGGIAESVLRSLMARTGEKEAEKQVFKKLRQSGSFREVTVEIGGAEYSVAVIDGLSGIEKLKQMPGGGARYDLVEVMTCPGGCVNGGGMIPAGSREAVRQRSKYVYLSDEQEAVRSPEKSSSISTLYEKVFKENDELADMKLFLTHFVKRDVLL
jgi:iron only hydrogenase large subunit-like protein